MVERMHPAPKDKGESREDLFRNYQVVSNQYYHPRIEYSPGEDVRGILKDIEEGTKTQRRLRAGKKGVFVAAPMVALGGAVGLAAVAAGTNVESHNPKFNPKVVGGFEEVVSPDSKFQTFKARQMVRAPFNLTQLNQAELDKIKAQITAAGFRLPEGTIDVETIRQNALGYYLDELAGIVEWTDVPPNVAEHLGLGAEKTIALRDGKIAKIFMYGSASPENQNSDKDLNVETPANLKLAEARAAVGKSALEKIFPGVRIENVRARVATLQPEQITELKRLSAEAKLDPSTLIKNYNTNPDSIPSTLKPFMDQYFGGTRGIEVEYEVTVPRGDKHTNWQADWLKGAGIVGGGAGAGLLLYLLLAAAKNRKQIKNEIPRDELESVSPVGPYVSPGYKPTTRTYGHAREGGPQPSEAEKKDAQALRGAINRLGGKVGAFRNDVITIHAKGVETKIKVSDALALAREAMQVHLEHGEY